MSFIWVLGWIALRFLIPCNSPLRFYLEGRMMLFRREEALLSIMEIFLFGLFAKWILWVSQVHVAILAFPNYPTPHFSLWLVCQVDFMSLPKAHCQMAKLTLQTWHSLVTNSTSSRQHCQIAKSTSPCGLPKWASSCPKNKKILDQCLSFYLVCPNSDCPSYFFFFHRLPRFTHHLAPLVSLFPLDLMALWSLRGALSKFQEKEGK